MSEIEDEAYSEAMEEIARKDAEIGRLKVDREIAAIALEIWIGEASAPNTRELITQLRRGSE